MSVFCEQGIQLFKRISVVLCVEIKPHLSRINVVHPTELNVPVPLGHCNTINLKVANNLLDFQEEEKNRKSARGILLKKVTAERERIEKRLFFSRTLTMTRELRWKTPVRCEIRAEGKVKVFIFVANAELTAL